MPEKTEKKTEQQKADHLGESGDSAEAAAERKRTRIMIPSQTGPGGSDDVFVSVNGRDYLIKRDVEVAVPGPVLEALKHAVITDYVTDADGRIVRERQVPRFPFQVL